MPVPTMTIGDRRVIWRASRGIARSDWAADWVNGSWDGIRKMEASAKRRRILALWLPRFSTDRLTRLIDSPDRAVLAKTPLVVAGRANNALYVYALNAAAS